MPRHTHVLIDPRVLAQNLRRARTLTPVSRVWAVVKADAYGHGLLAVKPALADADGLALIEFERARELRAASCDLTSSKSRIHSCSKSRSCEYFCGFSRSSSEH
jgi:alanine racemase